MVSPAAHMVDDESGTASAAGFVVAPNAQH
jgi:hypothetical protein